MSFSDAATGEASESVPTAGRRPRAICHCQAATRSGEAIGSATQRICPTQDEVRKSAERLRGSIREQPLMAVLIALGVGAVIARLAGSRERATGARR